MSAVCVSLNWKLKIMLVLYIERLKRTKCEYLLTIILFKKATSVLTGWCAKNKLDINGIFSILICKEIKVQTIHNIFYQQNYVSTKYWRKHFIDHTLYKHKHASNNSMMLVSQGIVFTMPDLPSRDLDFPSPTLSPPITGKVHFSSFSFINMGH